MTTLGVIGLGRIGAFHIETLRGLDSVDGLVITDERPDLVSAVAAKHDAKPADSVEQLLSSGVDGVVVASATAAHAELTLAAVERGLPTFCEKPIAATAAESARVADAITRSGVPVQVGYQRRFDAAFAAAKSAVDGGSLGPLHTVRSTTMDPAPPPMEFIAGSGGIFRDCAVHDFDVLRWITGQQAVEVYATGSVQGDPRFAEFNDVDTAAIVVTFERGPRRGVRGALQRPRLRLPPGSARLRRHRRRRLGSGRTRAECRPAQRFSHRSDTPVLHGPLHRGVPRRARRVRPGGRGRCRPGLHGGRRRRGRMAGRGGHRIPAPARTGAYRGGTRMSSLRIAGAPISWGVCEVPGWGYQLTPERVLAEMHDAGLSATELGPDGFLPGDPGELTALLGSHGLSCVGAFEAVLLHDADHDPVPDVAERLDALVAAGAPMLVLAAATGAEGYDSRPQLDDAQWATLLANLDRLAEVAAARGVTAVLHPHVGTMVENRSEVDRVLAGSAIPLCLDTGHLLIGGTDPLDLARAVPQRIAHTHLKDVDAGLAARVQSGELTYTEAVAQGMYRPLGAGDVDIAGIVSTLRDNGFDGWFVLEQDTILDGEPADEGPIRDVLASVTYLRGVAANSAPV